MQGFLRSTLRIDAVSLLPCSVGQGKSGGQARFKVRGNELCLLMEMNYMSMDTRKDRELGPFCDHSDLAQVSSSL